MYYSTKILHLRTQLTLSGLGYHAQALWYFLLSTFLSYLPSNHFTLTLPDEGYSINYISTFLIRYIIISVKTCQVTFHLCTLNFDFNKMVPIIEMIDSLESDSLTWFANKYQYFQILWFLTIGSIVHLSRYKTLH